MPLPIVAKMERVNGYFIIHKIESKCEGKKLHSTLFRALKKMKKLTYCFECYPSEGSQ